MHCMRPFFLPPNRAQAFIKDNVTGFQPRGDDLAYPSKLEAAAAAEAAGGGEINEGDAPEGEEAEARVSASIYTSYTHIQTC